MELLTTRGSGARKVERLLQSLEQRGTVNLDRVERQVRRIVDDVRRGGDRALLAARDHFDGVPKKQPLRIAPGEIHRAWQETSPELHAALKLAARNIMQFAKRQLPQEWDTEPVPGVKTGQRVRALSAVGCYVPSGRHPLPSSLLMTAIPAQVAGVRRIVIVSPRPARETLAAAALLGIDEVYQVGGAQAIAALAYGTPSLPRVDKIVGPGNLYVTAAKRMVAFDCGIDMLAGPTEIVVSSERGHPEAIAADLVAQAEHDTETLSVLVTSQSELAKQVMCEVKEQSKRNPVAREALRNHGYVIVTDTKEQAREATNRLAAEHLTVDSEEDLQWVENAGSVFIGNWSSQPLGDYVSGPNHTLPTGGAARLRGGLSVMDFLRLVTVQSYTADGVRALGPAAMALANAEGLSAHAAAVERRLLRA
ncbi:MAG TPA: histidinol dehydrogenase [Acidobacteriaceae bacterium]|nr:histidinol dehydrogenase [Acidobacteriaceae bacterium]